MRTKALCPEGMRYVTGKLCETVDDRGLSALARLRIGARATITLEMTYERYTLSPCCGFAITGLMLPGVVETKLPIGKVLVL